MIRGAFTMKILPGTAEEYKKRHDEIWPEMADVLHQAGVSDYSIFLDEESLTLFATWKLSDDNKTAELPKHPMVQKWWAHMADIMETHPDNSPVACNLREVFHMD